MASNNKNERIEAALNSLDSIDRADPGPWFYARVMNRINEPESVWERIGVSLTRPVMLLASLVLILFINGYFLINQASGDTGLSSQAQQDLSTVTDSESLMASSSSFDYENFVQP